jgi:hypothetical protein
MGRRPGLAWPSPRLCFTSSINKSRRFYPVVQTFTPGIVTSRNRLVTSDRCSSSSEFIRSGSSSLRSDLSDFSSSTERSTCSIGYQPSHDQSICSTSSLSNGRTANSTRSSPVERLDGKDRSGGSVSSRANSSRLSTLLQVPVAKACIPMDMRSIRLPRRTSYLHTTHASDSEGSPQPRSPTGSLHGRYPTDVIHRAPVFSRSRHLVNNFIRVWFHNKPIQVCPPTLPNDAISWSGSGLSRDDPLIASNEDAKVDSTSSQDATSSSVRQTNRPASITKTDRSSPISFGLCLTREDALQLLARSAPISRTTLHRGIVSTGDRGPPVVGGPSSNLEREKSPVSPSGFSVRHGCEREGLGSGLLPATISPIEDRERSRKIEKDRERSRTIENDRERSKTIENDRERPETTANDRKRSGPVEVVHTEDRMPGLLHLRDEQQHAGVDRGSERSPIDRRCDSLEIMCGSSSDRQPSNNELHQSDGWSGTTPLSTSGGDSFVRSGTQDPTVSRVLTRSPQPSSGRSLSSGIGQFRIDVAPLAVPAPGTEMGPTHDRCSSIINEHSIGSIPLVSPRSTLPLCGLLQSSPGRTGELLSVSAGVGSSHSSLSSTVSARTSGSNNYSSSLADPTLVAPRVAAVPGLALNTTSSPRNVDELGRREGKDITPVLALSRSATIRRHFLSEGFSDDFVDVWFAKNKGREDAGTNRKHDQTWARFETWLTNRGGRPYDFEISHITQYVTEVLMAEGKSAATARSFLSMCSVTRSAFRPFFFFFFFFFKNF